jgi:hypothetical protein
LQVGIPANASIERPRRLLLKLLLPRVEVVRMDLIPLREVSYRRTRSARKRPAPAPITPKA